MPLVIPVTAPVPNDDGTRTADDGIKFRSPKPDQKQNSKNAIAGRISNFG